MSGFDSAIFSWREGQQRLRDAEPQDRAVLERVTGSTMGAAIRDLVAYERLGLTHTWQETIESEPADLPPLSHQYEGEHDVAEMDAFLQQVGGER